MSNTKENKNSQAPPETPGPQVDALTPPDDLDPDTQDQPPIDSDSPQEPDKPVETNKPKPGKGGARNSRALDPDSDGPLVPRNEISASVTAARILEASKSRQYAAPTTVSEGKVLFRYDMNTLRGRQTVEHLLQTSKSMPNGFELLPHVPGEPENIKVLALPIEVHKAMQAERSRILADKGRHVNIQKSIDDALGYDADVVFEDGTVTELDPQSVVIPPY